MALSVCILQTRYIGDVILLVPLIREIQQSDRTARITVVINEGTGYPLERFPGVRTLSLPREGRLRRTSGTVKIAASLFPRKFDLLLDLTLSDRSRFLSRMIRARTKGAAGDAGDLSRGGPWSVRHPVDTNRGPEHRIRMQADLLEALGIPTSGITEKSYFPDPRWIERAKSWIAERRLGDLPLLFLHPGGRHWYKCWPPDRFARLASRWVERTGGGVVVAGSNADRTLVDSVINGTSGPRIFPLTGVPLGFLDALIRWSRVFVGSDSGPLHMADAAHVPLVGLFGSTLPAVWGPTSSPDLRVLYDPPPCSPCPHTGCAMGENNCLVRLSVDRVDAQVAGAFR